MPKTPPPPADPPKKESPVATRIFEELGKINKRLDTLEEQKKRRERAPAHSSSRNIFGDEEE